MVKNINSIQSDVMGISMGAVQVEPKSKAHRQQGDLVFLKRHLSYLLNFVLCDLLVCPAVIERKRNHVALVESI